MGCNCNKKGGNDKKPLNQPVPSKFSSGLNKSPRRTMFPSPPKVQEEEPEVPEIEGETLEDKRLTFAYMLGLEEPVSEEVLLAAIENSSYAQRLLMNKQNTTYFYDLLNNPPSVPKINKHRSSLLIKKAGKALFNWGLSGFPTVSKTTLIRRESACLACPQLIEPVNALQKIAARATISDQPGSRTGNKVCSACGCVVRNKIRLATETCPLEAPGTPGQNFWEEPFVPDPSS